MDKKILISVGVVVVVGAILGLGVAGVIPIPGLGKKPKAAAASDKKDDKKDDKQPDTAANVPKDPKSSKPAAEAKSAKDTAGAVAKKESPPEPTPADLARGYKKLAGVWGEMAPADVSKLLVDHYKPEQAAPILKLMDEDQVAAIFTALSKSTPAAAKGGDSQTAGYCEALAKEVSKPVLTDPTKT